MIINTFINIVYNILEFFVNKLPEVSGTSIFGSAISTGNQYISAVHSFLPHTTVALIAIIAFDLIFEGSYFIFKMVYWVIRRLPTQS